MARVRLGGQEYVCEPVELRDDGLWVMKMRMHGPRWAAGGTYACKQAEIVEMAAAETPIVRDALSLMHKDLSANQEPLGDAGQAALEAAMAAERETIPTVQDLLAVARKDGTVVNPKPEEDAA